MSRNNLPLKFLIFATTLLVLIFTIENINHRFWLNDFKVYYGAAQALMHGEQVYGVAFALGSGYYKYSPFTAILFVPLALLPYKAASVIQYFLLAGVILILFHVVWNLVNGYLFNDQVTNKNALLSIA